MAGQYTHTTAAEARTQLRSRLHDTGASRFWTEGELAASIAEALRVWQALTASWYARSSPLPLSTDKLDVVDLHETAGSLVPFTVTDWDLSQEILQHLLEYTTVSAPPDPLVWNGTEQFNWGVILAALNRRMQSFLFETGCVVRRLPYTPVPSSPIGRVEVGDEVIDIRRAVWLGEGDFPTVLARETEHSANSFDPGWYGSPDVPMAYSVASTPGASLQLIPPPSVAGRLDLYCVAAGERLTNLGVKLRVPADFCWAVKWGALADLLGAAGSRSSDPLRAQYAEGMYRLGVQVAILNPSVKGGRVNDVPVNLDTVYSLDQFSPDWQNDPPGEPYTLAMLGRNLIVPYPIPDASQGWMATLDIVGNFPVYDQYLQVGKEIVQPILDYAQHVAAFKLGGEEFVASVPLRDNFFRAAAEQNGRIRAILDRLYLEQPGRTFDQQAPAKLNNQITDVQK